MIKNIEEKFNQVLKLVKEYDDLLKNIDCEKSIKEKCYMDISL